MFIYDTSLEPMQSDVDSRYLYCPMEKTKGELRGFEYSFFRVTGGFDGDAIHTDCQQPLHKHHDTEKEAIHHFINHQLTWLFLQLLPLVRLLCADF